MAAEIDEADEARSDSANLVVDGVKITAALDWSLVEGTLLPALEEVAGRPRTTRRAFVFLVGPPGVGKTTLAAVLSQAARDRRPDPLDLDVVSIDGFHYPNRYLDSHPVPGETQQISLGTIKGAPETFDIASLSRHLVTSADRDVAWPVYDRRLHDVVPGTEPVHASLVLLEGTWLLLDEPGWRDLARHASLVVFLTAEPALLGERLIGRKARGGLTRAAAEEFYERSDRRNVERVLTCSDLSKVDLALRLQADGTMTQGEAQ